MKTIKNLKTFALFASLALAFTSCEKSELEEGTVENFDNTIQTEGFKSISGNSDTEISDFSNEKAILHATYKGNLTEKEANAKFEIEAARFMKKYKETHRNVNTEWFYRIVTRTGTQINSGTDANVWGRVTFQTDKGYRNAGWVRLDNLGDDRQRGAWDYYIFRTTYPGEAVSWVATECAQIALQGTDDWFVTHFYAQVYTYIQTLPSTGYSRIISTPNVWLYNNTSSGWDYYTNCNGVGSLYF